MVVVVAPAVELVTPGIEVVDTPAAIVVDVAVVATMVRGTVVCRDGEIVGAPGYGRFQRPNLDVDGGRAIAGALWGAGPL